MVSRKVRLSGPGAAAERREESDEALVARLRDGGVGDLQAFEILVERYQERVVANCRYLSGSAADAADLSQEVFVKAYFGLGRFEARSTFSTWLQRIKINHCLNFLEQSKRQSHVALQDLPAATPQQMRVEPRGEQDLVAREERVQIRAVLDAIPETLRIPLILRDMDGLSYQEIATHLGIGLSAVKMRIKRGRAEFRRLYGPTREMDDAGADRVAVAAPVGVPA